ncbi:hypothetical protein cypCar_00030646 [Cyprinus carpio]|nr:hypothetical protein cypCar_00030646 [Cyprinus carpio]
MILLLSELSFSQLSFLSYSVRQGPRKCCSESHMNKKMLRLLFLFLILRGAVDDEDGDAPVETRRIQYSDPGEIPKVGPGSDRSTGDDEANEGGTLIIIIAAVSVIVLAIGGIVAIFLFRRYLQSREQGVYSVPAEQGQKAAV